MKETVTYTKQTAVEQSEVVYVCDRCSGEVDGDPFEFQLNGQYAPYIHFCEDCFVSVTNREIPDDYDEITLSETIPSTEVTVETTTVQRFPHPFAALEWVRETDNDGVFVAIALVTPLSVLFFVFSSMEVLGQDTDGINVDYHAKSFLATLVGGFFWGLVWLLTHGV